MRCQQSRGSSFLAACYILEPTDLTRQSNVNTAESPPRFASHWNLSARVCICRKQISVTTGVSSYLLTLQRYHRLPFYSLLTAKYVKADAASMVTGHLLHRWSEKTAVSNAQPCLPLWVFATGWIAGGNFCHTTLKICISSAVITDSQGAKAAQWLILVKLDC